MTLLDTTLNPQFIARKKYEKGFAYVQKEIADGNSYVTNLTTLSEIHIAKASLSDLYTQLVAPYKLWMVIPADHGLRAQSAIQEILVFSPECFIQTRKNRIHTFPMKGTARVEGGMDKELVKNKLLSDPKEEAEHITVVDLLRNDLGKVAKSITVDSLRNVCEIHTGNSSILQTSSHISAELEENWQDRLGSMLYDLLPAGSVSGAPKKKTCEIIQRAEQLIHGNTLHATRGYYCGVAGVFTGQNIDSCVLIRYIERRGKRFFFRSGGGITCHSTLLSEYEELKAKVHFAQNYTA